MGQTPQEFIAAIFEHDGFGDHRAEPRHPLAEPGWNAAMMKRQIGAARTTSYNASKEMN